MCFGAIVPMKKKRKKLDLAECFFAGYEVPCADSRFGQCKRADLFFIPFPNHQIFRPPREFTRSGPALLGPQSRIFLFLLFFFFFCDRQPFRSSLQFPLITLHHITTNQQKHQQPTTSTHFNNAKGRVEKVQPKDRAPLKGEEGREGCRLSLCRLCCQPCFRTPFQQGSRSAYLEEPLGRSGNC